MPEVPRAIPELRLWSSLGGRSPWLDRAGHILMGFQSGTYTVRMRFTAAVTHEPPWYVARCLEVEVASQGKSIEEALTSLKEALELYFEDASPPEKIEPPIIASVELSA
jgi:predicted RNase H-like HicB family nuclease